MSTPTATPKSTGTLPAFPGKDVPFGVNEVRLNLRQWTIAALIILTVALLIPRLWERIEKFNTGPDYRIPYALSKDYWLYGRRLRQDVRRNQIVLLGDSVIWGEYVLPDGTLSHFLNQEAGATNRFINGGLNGLFPLAQEGLVTYYSGSLRNQKVLLHCNVLWMTSPKADLSTTKEEQFNHSALVPQFTPRIPCYKADANERLSAIVQRDVDFVAWVNHLQNAYYDQKSILSWTLADDGSTPPHYPNVYKNPLSQITLTVPLSPENDPQRGPASARHKPWSENGQGTVAFDWVSLNASMQWQAFQRVLRTLRERGNEVFVVLGPFNEHIMAEDNRVAYRKTRDGIAEWLNQNKVPNIVPETLPSLLYADASHPLTQGYQLLAQRLIANADFQRWLAHSR
ncbi:MAG TPA: hypothetical protein VL361_03890 [Candidatus Limnocylindrales bacterium]|jgi:hypothetical protein|nr:hypothetical protein [Candidatus Limnocylindrales bacterium]